MINDVLTAFGVVFLAELPDKTMFATLLLSSHYANRSAVWCGVTTAYSAHVVLAVVLGGVIARLPDDPVRYGVSAVFVCSGVFMVWNSRRMDRDERTISHSVAHSWWRIYGVSFGAIGIAEFADITQLATASLAATRNSPIGVGIGAALALAMVSAFAVTIGATLAQKLPIRIIQGVAGVLFVFVGLASAGPL